MMGWIGNGRRMAPSRAARALTLGAFAWGVGACGSSSDSQSTLFEPLAPPGTVGDVPPDPPATPPATAPSSPSETPSENPEGTPPVMMGSTPPAMGGMAAEGERQPGACRAPLGVSGAPETISQAIVLINTLPKPTTLECFVQALERPLSLYFTSSDQSLQPAPDALTPRTFIQRGNLYMSIVLGGSARDTLEFGYRPVPNRSIKAEIEFPITRDLTESTLFDRIAQSDTTTVCGACHVSEGREDFPDFPDGAYVSEIYSPFPNLEVDLETMRSEAVNCDEAADSGRCSLLAALFENGPLRQGTLPAKQ